MACFLHEKRKASVGMWKNGTSLETPGQYKRRTKQGVAPEIIDDIAEAGGDELSWFRLKLKTVFGRP